MGRLNIDVHATARARRGYYGMISHIDAMFGRLMDALSDSGVSENTLVIFASDHGDMMGERGMWFKKTLFEPAIHVPLIVGGLGIAQRRVATPVSLLDLLPTLVDVSGAPAGTICTPFNGQSLVPLLHGGSKHDPVMVEHLDGGTDAPRVMLRDGDLKLVLSRAYPTMLFNLSDDPFELNDLASDPAASNDMARLLAKAHEIWDLDALAIDKHANQTARTVVNTALQTGRPQVWDFTPGTLAQNSNYVRSGDKFPDVERRSYLPAKVRR
ncbi:sulfatase-like hydrolase/transferase [Boseongicola aestuarii]|uniref:Choline-sulfatase n=1 Tax=Boseongicola aestuarii TaxID=1470561 RepID=A0A238J6L8_9RHOB|nr:sulfatase-like hydrolase/transferase [Boseongicola aestuarii]SMX25882.1 Choline-sulfatase [Boseongicola aestuarii]